MSGEGCTRRAALSSGLVAIGALLGVAACKKEAKFSCEDTSGLPQADADARKTLGYTDTAPDPARACAGCQQFQTPVEGGACGTCKLLKGPIHPNGTCKAFTARS